MFIKSLFQIPQDHHDLPCENLKILLGYMATYFPFRPDIVTNRDIKVCSNALEFALIKIRFFFVKVEQFFRDLNLIYCELTSLLLLASYTRSANSSRTSRGKSQLATQASEGSLQAQRVSEYVIQLLRGEPSSGSQLGRSLTPQAYTTLLPTIWALLHQSSPNKQQESSTVLQAVLEHATDTSSNSAVKKLEIEFVARLVLVSPFAPLRSL